MGPCIFGELCLLGSSCFNLKAIWDRKLGALDSYLLLFPLQTAAFLCVPRLDALQMPEWNTLQTKTKT